MAKYTKYFSALFTVLITLWTSGDCAVEIIENREPVTYRLGAFPATGTGVTTTNISSVFELHGLIAGGVNLVNVEIAGLNSVLVELAVGVCSFQGAMPLETIGRMQLTSANDHTNKIILDITGTGLTTTDAIQRELKTLFQLDIGAPIAMRSASRDLSSIITNIQVGAATPPGIYGLSYGYNSTGETVTYKTSSGLNVWEKTYDAFSSSDALLDRNARTIAFDNGLTITTAANNDERSPMLGVEIFNVENLLWQPFDGQEPQLFNPIYAEEPLLINLKQNVIDLKKGEYVKSAPSLITPKNIVQDEELAPPVLFFKELYFDIMNNIDSYIDSNGQQWEAENVNQLGAFFQGTPFSEITTQAARPIRVVNDSVAGKISVYYALKQILILNTTYYRYRKRFELCLSRSTLTKEEQAEKDEAELMLCEERDQRRSARETAKARVAKELTYDVKASSNTVAEWDEELTEDKRAEKKEKARMARERCLKAAEERARAFVENNDK